MTPGTDVSKWKLFVNNATCRDAIGPEFDPTEPYVVGQCVWHDGELYRFTSAHAAGTWMGTDVINITAGGGLYGELSEKINKPTVNPNGTNGQLLRTNGDGTTAWVNHGTPTAEQVGAAVDDWLDAHPEATTTVDFSIATKVFSNVASMVADVTLESGDNVATRGYYASGDGGGDNFVVSASHTGTFYSTLSNGLYANRLREDQYINVNKIGAKSYATEALALEDTAGMENNNTVVQAAIDAGFSPVFDKGVYAFESAINVKVNVDVRGLRRELTSLYFPNGIGLNFAVVAAEYHYQYYGDMRIHSLGNCINITADVANVIQCRFNQLWLVSEEGECIVAPRNNNGYRGSTDTCVWTCYFSFIQAESKVGAMVANVKGLGNWFFQFLMLGETQKAFRNCSGTFIRLDTGCLHPKVCFYYDDVEDYGLDIYCQEVHFEACEESFIYTENSTASTMALSVYAVDSGVTRPQMRNSSIPYIKVGRLISLESYGKKYNLLPPESLFDMEALHGAIIHIYNQEMAYNNSYATTNGGKDGLKIWSISGNKLYKFYGLGKGNTIYQNYYTPWEIVNSYGMMNIETMSGGRGHQNLVITDSDLPSGTAKNINISSKPQRYCDVVRFKLTSDTSTVTIRSLATGDALPGKVLTIMNDVKST